MRRARRFHATGAGREIRNHRIKVRMSIVPPQKIEKMLAQSVGFSHALGNHKAKPDFNANCVRFANR